MPLVISNKPYRIKLAGKIGVQFEMFHYFYVLIFFPLCVGKTGKAKIKMNDSLMSISSLNFN